MNTQVFDVLTRRAAAVSRRGSLLTLAGAAVAAADAAPAGATGGKPGKKAKKKSKRKCKQQAAQCALWVLDVRQDLFACVKDPSACDILLNVCCPFLGTCQSAAFNECYISALSG